MYPNLTAIGITNPDTVEKYTVRTEGHFDVLKVYYNREKGDLFARSEKFKYPRQHKRVKVDSGTGAYNDTTEISTTLRYVIEELDQVAKQESIPELDLKKQILQDLRHLEKVVQSKIAEIEANLERL
jgi:hypothetical protein|tara:strand:- start:2347 stop:2727 length:381 start_codon:yes stop_codon:yes gene_type:complete